MSRLTVSLVFLTQFFLFSFQAMAGSVEEHVVQGPDKALIYTVINFILLVILLSIGLRRPAKEFFSSKSLKTKMDIDEAKKLYDDAYRRFEEMEAKLKNADRESKEMIHRFKEHAELEKHRLIGQAREFSEKIKMDARRIADHEVQKAKHSLKAEVVRLSADLAAKKIKEELTNDDQVRLGTRFVEEIKKVGTL